MWAFSYLLILMIIELLLQVFYLIEGAINLKIHRTSFVLATGGMFLIPRGTIRISSPHSLSYSFSGNNYYLENISQRPARLFFAQARKIVAGEDETQVATPVSRKSIDPPALPNGQATAKSGSVGRSSSVATPSASERGKSANTKRAASTSK